MLLDTIILVYVLLAGFPRVDAKWMSMHAVESWLSLWWQTFFSMIKMSTERSASRTHLALQGVAPLREGFDLISPCIQVGSSSHLEGT